MMIISRPRRRQQGYSLVEMLVVVAIIGLISLIAVPNFMSLYRGSRFKSVMRGFVSTVRNTQQRAITENRRMRISFAVNSKSFTLSREVTNDTTGVKTWETLTSRTLDTRGDGVPEAAYFSATGFQDLDADGRSDVIFNPNGTVDMPTAPNLPMLVIKTDDTIAKPQYTVTFSLVGQVRAT